MKKSLTFILILITFLSLPIYAAVVVTHAYNRGYNHYCYPNGYCTTPTNYYNSGVVVHRTYAPVNRYYGRTVVRHGNYGARSAAVRVRVRR